MPKITVTRSIDRFCWASSLGGVFLLTLISACGSSEDKFVAPERSVVSLRFIGEQRIAFKQDVKGTPAGGLSGIDYDPISNTWVFQSDDRSDLAPARFYTAQLRYDSNKFDFVSLPDVKFLKQADGTNFPNLAQYRSSGGELPDFESIRFDPIDGSIWYSSEGGRALGFGLDPFVRQATLDGTHLVNLATPALLKVSLAEELGTRNNVGFEGLTFSADGKSIWVAMEGPIYQDGELPTVTSGSTARLTHMNREGAVLGQFVYPLGTLPAESASGRRGDNGVSEILSVNDHEFLVLERSGIEGADGIFKNYIRLYAIDISGATDVSTVASLKNTSYVPVSKRLVLDLNTLALDRLDNIEGMAWGPKLSNGRDSIVMVSDDNYSTQQVTQLLAFEVASR